MKIAFQLLVAGLMLSPSAWAADPPGFAIWKAGELKQHDEALSKHIADDHQYPETLFRWAIIASGCSTAMPTAIPSSTTRSSTTSSSSRAARAR